ncbi:hypothetical protein ADUPG1_012920 [Aduncisulcus paluster]|uniref:Uncharacterized protein n=1 Tax=Aduncisulcus paluster TaxID=2918883 RepID=A0ABQ5K146_9EUKA|nr:hypothetical protein ADUPG1_012920 [Aduncisulcus paluster]
MEKTFPKPKGNPSDYPHKIFKLSKFSSDGSKLQNILKPASALSVSGAGCMCGYYAVFGALGEIPLDQAISPNNETQSWVKSRQKVHQYSRLSEDMSLIDEVEERYVSHVTPKGLGKLLCESFGSPEGIIRWGDRIIADIPELTLSSRSCDICCIESDSLFSCQTCGLSPVCPQCSRVGRKMVCCICKGTTFVPYEADISEEEQAEKSVEEEEEEGRE